MTLLTFMTHTILTFSFMAFSRVSRDRYPLGQGRVMNFHPADSRVFLHSRTAECSMAVVTISPGVGLLRRDASTMESLSVPPEVKNTFWGFVPRSDAVFLRSWSSLWPAASPSGCVDDGFPVYSRAQRAYSSIALWLMGDVAVQSK